MEGSKPKPNNPLFNLLKFNIFETVYAKRSRCMTEKKNESGDCGDSQSPVPPPAPPSECGEPAGVDKGKECSGPCPSTSGHKRCDLGDLGKVGAGMTGSRSKKEKESPVCLPSDAESPVRSSAEFPGLLRHLHDHARHLIPNCFEGGVLNVRQPAGNWGVGHTMSFSQVCPGGYRLLLTYTGDKETVGIPYCLVEAAPGGQTCFEGRVAPTSWMRATLVAQRSKGNFVNWEGTFDSYFRESTSSIITVNQEMMAVHYLKKVNERLAVGAEMVLQGTEQSSASAAVKWALDGRVASASFGNRGIDLCYAHQSSTKITIGALLEVGFATRRALATLAYQYRGDDFTFRGSVDTDGLVGGLLCRTLGGGDQFNLFCALSGLYNHANEKFRLGFGVTAVIN